MKYSLRTIGELIGYLQYGSADDNAVKSVEGRVEVSGQAKSIHPYTCSNIDIFQLILKYVKIY